MKEPNEIDLLFQSAEFDGLELTPDPFVKQNIDHAIASKKKRRRFLFILFPVLFAISSFAAMLYVLPFSENSTQNKPVTADNQLHETDKSPTSTSIERTEHQETKHHASDSSLTKRSAAENTSVSKPQMKATGSFKVSKSLTQTKSKTTLRVNGKAVSSGEETTLPASTEIKEQLLLATSTPERSENQIPAEQDSITLAENKPDSTSVSALPDSTKVSISEPLKSMESNKDSHLWSLSVLTYWEGEKKRASDFKNDPFTENKKENARIHSSTFYAKIEVSRKLTTRLEALTGIGFRSSKVVQYGDLDKIEFPIEGVSTGVPISNTTDTIHWTEVQSFRVNSVVLPIGLAYSFPIGKKMQLRLSGGGEFAYGQITSRNLHPDLSTPNFRPFGCSVWLRPEIHYSFGRSQLFGFGTFNQSLSQQLKWDFEPRRNPAFGAGIGFRMSL